MIYTRHCDGAQALAQGVKKDKVRRGKTVLPIDFKFKDGPSEEEEPGDIINRSDQASPGSSVSCA